MPPPPPEPAVSKPVPEILRAAVEDLPPPGKDWKNVTTPQDHPPARLGVWGSPGAAAAAALGERTLSGALITCNVLFTAATHSTTPISGNVAAGGSAYLAKHVMVNASVHGVEATSVSVVPLVLRPAEEGSARFRVDASASSKKLETGAVPLVAVVATLVGDSADVYRLLHPKSPRVLTSKGRGPNGVDCSVELQVRAHALVTPEIRDGLESSQTHLPNGSPMLVSAPRDATLGELQRLLDEAVGPGFGAVLQMPESHTASPDQRVLAMPREDGAVRADLLTLTIWDLQKHSEGDRAALRQRLHEQGFCIRRADNLEALQPGGRVLANFAPSRALVLTGPAAVVGSVDSTRRFVRRLLSHLPQEVADSVCYGADARRADLEALYEASVLIYPALEGGTRALCRATIVMPSDAAARSVCGAMTVPPGDPTKPLVHVASRASVRVKVGDVVLCRRVDGEVTPHALHRHRTNNATRPCSNDCGAAAHHLGMDPNFAFLRSVSGPEATDGYIAAIEHEVSTYCDLSTLHLDKPWSSVPQDAQEFLQRPRNSYLLVARGRLRALRGVRPPAGDTDPEPKGTMANRCLRGCGRQGRDFAYSCYHCLLPGHQREGCVLSPERALYLGANAQATRASYIATLARAKPGFFRGTPVSAAAAPASRNQQVASHFGAGPRAQASARAPPAQPPGAPLPPATAAPRPAAAPVPAQSPAAPAPPAVAVPRASAGASPQPPAGVWTVARGGRRRGGGRAGGAAALGPGAIIPRANHLRREAINLPPGGISASVWQRGAAVAMTDDERPRTPPGARTAGAKRQHSPPRRQSGATPHDTDSYFDEEAANELDDDEHYSDDSMADDASDSDAWLLEDPVVLPLRSHFLAAIRELPENVTGFDAAFACVTSVPEEQRGAAWHELKQAFSDHPEAFAATNNPFDVAELLLDLYKSHCELGAKSRRHGRYPKPQRAYRREDVGAGAGSCSPPPYAAVATSPLPASSGERQTHLTTPASAATPLHLPSGDTFPFAGMARGFLNNRPPRPKAASPAASQLPASLTLLPGKDPTGSGQPQV